MIIPVPVGQTYTATVSGRGLKLVCCEHCACEYVYGLERNVSGHASSLLWLDNEGAKKRAEDSASTSVKRTLRAAVDPVACPKCGWFQGNMVPLLKRRGAWKIAIFGLAGALGLAIIVAILEKPSGLTRKLPWSIAALSVAGASAFYICHDPNKSCREAAAKNSPGVTRQEFEAHVSKLVGKPMEGLSRALFLEQQEEDEKESELRTVPCFSCGKKIRVEADVCEHCGKYIF